MVNLLTKQLDEQVVTLHLLAFGTELTVPTQTQADKTGVKVEGVFKTEYLRRKHTLAHWTLIVDIVRPQKIVPSSPVAHSAIGDCRHHPSFLLDVVFLHDTGAAAALIGEALE